MRSFGVVESKVFETEFFMEKIENCMEYSECSFYLSAFLSASRSITFALQSSMSDVVGFTEWYLTQQEKMQKSQLCNFFKLARNESQKIGVCHITGGSCRKKEDGTLVIKHYLHSFIEENGSISRPPEELKEHDLYSLCKMHFLFLLEIVHDCFQSFGPIIDPAQYYTLENMKKLGKTIEDIEESMGFPRGWTSLGGNDESSSELRMKMLRSEQPQFPMHLFFSKYLQ